MEDSFHEWTVLSLSSNRERLELSLEGPSTDGRTPQATITVKGVQSILADDSEVEELRMPFPDGEVLKLSLSDNSLDLLIEWNDFLSRQSFIASYRVLGASMSVELR